MRASAPVTGLVEAPTIFLRSSIAPPTTSTSKPTTTRFTSSTTINSVLRRPHGAYRVSTAPPLSRIKIMSELRHRQRQGERPLPRSLQGKLIDFHCLHHAQPVHGENALLRVLNKESMSEKLATTLDVP